MSGFPPKKWEARFLQDMETLQCNLKEGETLSMEAYVAVKPSGGQEGNFRFTLAGTERLRLEFPVNKILPEPAFANMIIELEMVPGDQIRLEKNSACSTCWDLWRIWLPPRMSWSPTGKARICPRSSWPL